MTVPYGYACDYPPYEKCRNIIRTALHGASPECPYTTNLQKKNEYIQIYPCNFKQPESSAFDQTYHSTIPMLLHRRNNPLQFNFDFRNFRCRIVNSYLWMWPQQHQSDFSMGFRKTTESGSWWWPKQWSHYIIITIRISILENLRLSPIISTGPKTLDVKLWGKSEKIVKRTRIERILEVIC